jgi:uncharacterized membrane protein (DUF2068 family)
MSGSNSDLVISKSPPNPNRDRVYLLLVKCLALLMMGVGSWVIFNRLHHWRLYTSENMNNFASDTTMINLRLMVTLVLGSSGLVPIILGVGLWYRRCWARTLSLCLFTALLLPALATVAKLTTSPLVQERPLLNPIIIVVSVLGLSILLWPTLVLAIRARQSKRG